MTARRPADIAADLRLYRTHPSDFYDLLDDLDVRAHLGIRNEDEGVCDADWWDGQDEALSPCVLVPLTYDPAAARAALDARRPA